MRPVTSGRVLVRSIKASMSRSITILMAFAPPAANVPPMRVIATRPQLGQPFSAKTMVGTVVMSSSSTTRNFIRTI